MATLAERAAACNETRTSLAQMLLTIATHVVDAARTAGLVGVEVFNGYWVMRDPEKGELILTKLDNSGAVLFIVSGEISLPHLEEFAEDVLNGLVQGATKTMNDQVAKGQKLYKELESSDYLASLASPETVRETPTP